MPQPRPKRLAQVLSLVLAWELRPWSHSITFNGLYLVPYRRGINTLYNHICDSSQEMLLKSTVERYFDLTVETQSSMTVKVEDQTWLFTVAALHVSRRILLKEHRLRLPQAAVQHVVTQHDFEIDIHVEEIHQMNNV